MAPMRAHRFAPGLVCLLACGSLALAGCGSSDSSSHVNPEAEAGKSVPAPAKSTFPAPEGRTLKEFVTSETTAKTGIQVTPSAEAFYPGAASRYPFLVSEKPVKGAEGKEIPDAEVAIYYAEAPQKAKASPWREPAIGPFPARIETLATEPGFQGETTTEDPTVASVVYSAALPLSTEGKYKPIALIKQNGGFSEETLRTINVGEFDKIPRPGEKAPLIQTPTAASVGGDLAKLSTRVPPDTMNEVNYAEVLGKEPILLLFTTPKFCQSRVCGPAVDVAEQAQQKYKGKANFIHMEIYNDNDPAKGVRPQVRRFHLPTEPWLFAINREGVVSAAIEGAVGTELMDKTVERVISE
jgi:hypothetical protein